MKLELTSPPATEPVSLEEAKLYCRVDYTADDTLLSGLIKTARHHCESTLKKALITQSWTLKLDCWEDLLDRYGRIRLFNPPLQSVTSIKYYSGGSLATMSSSDYLVLPGTPGRIEPVSGFPSHDDRGDAIEILYVCGYGTASAVPETVKSAMKQLIAFWYDNRDAASKDNLTQIPYGVEALLECEGWSW